MAIRELKGDIYSVGAIDWDRRLFDELIPLPDGTSYNSYLIKGSEKTALIDTVDPTKGYELIGNLKKLDVKNIDYVISNHAEQDHSGSIPKILELYPDATVVTNPKCKDFLKDLLLIPEDKFIAVNDGDTLSLGNKTLEFILAPWVHWPETMFTYLKEDKILFTCDFLGSHLATSDLFVADEAKVYESAKRYYAEIMMPFRTSIKKHLERIKGIEVEIAATSHGPIYKRPEFILKKVRKSDPIASPPMRKVFKNKIPNCIFFTTPENERRERVAEAIRLYQKELGYIAINADKWQNTDEAKEGDKVRDKKSSAKARKVAGQPRRYKFIEESISGQGSRLGGKVHGVREGAGEYGSSAGTPGEGKDSTRPVDSTRYFETAQGIKTYSEVAEILAVSVAKTIEAIIDGTPEDIHIAPEQTKPLSRNITTMTLTICSMFSKRTGAKFRLT